MTPLRTKTTCCEFHADGGAYGSRCSSGLGLKPLTDDQLKAVLELIKGITYLIPLEGNDGK